jgi:hypothetical protein
VRQYGLTFSMPVKELTQHLVGKGRSLTFDALTAADLAEQRSTIVDARVCTTIHPSGRTLVSWLREVGFRQVHSTHSGADFAGHLFRQLPTERRPADVEAIDALLRPLIAIVVEMGAPISDDPMITAIK